MRRLLGVAVLVGCGVVWGAAPASAQLNCITINGTNQCAAPLRLFDATVRRVSTPVWDVSQTWNDPSITFTGTKVNITDTGSASGSLLADWQVNGVSKFSVSKSGAQIAGGLLGLGTTSTAGFTLNNLTPSTSTTTVQISPSLKWCGTAWNSTSVASETDCWFIENLPVTVAGATTSTLKFGRTIAGGAATYPMQLTSGGVLSPVTDGTSDIGTSVLRFRDIYASRNFWAVTQFGFLSSSLIKAPGDGQFNLTNNAGTDFTSLQLAGDVIYSFAIPTITSGFSTSAPSIAGKASAFAVTIGTPTVGSTTGLVAFNATFTNIPSCSCQNTITANLCQAVPTTTTVTINGVWVASDILRVSCLGY